MNPNEQARQEGRGYYTHVKDLNHNFATRGINARTAMVPCGIDGDKNSPMIGVIWVNCGPADLLRGRHSHPGDAINLVVDGAMYMDGKWLRPGQAKIVPAELVYGDQITSPDGVVFLEIFENHAAAKPEFENPDCQAYYQEVHEKYLFKD